MVSFYFSLWPCRQRDDGKKISFSGACMGKPLHDTLGGDCCCCIAEDRGCWWRKSYTSRWYPRGGVLEMKWRHWLLDDHDEEAGREEKFLLTVDFQSHVSSAVNGSSVCTHFFTFTLMMTGAFSWNVRKVFFRLNCRTQLWTLKNSLVKNSLMKNFKIFTKHWISSGFHQMYVTAITRCTLHLSLL